MDRGQVTYLSYMTLAENIPGILRHGILSHNLVQEHEHRSVADADVQALRARRTLPNGRDLHDYANLYFWARNAMMYRIRDRATLCVLKISPQVIDLPGTYYSTRNAATNEAEFYPCLGDFDGLDSRVLYARSWATNGEIDVEKMQAMQAELLVPDRIVPELIERVFVRSAEARELIRPLCGRLDVTEHARLFFD